MLPVTCTNAILHFKSNVFISAGYHQKFKSVPHKFKQLPHSPKHMNIEFVSVKYNAFWKV